MYIHIYMYTPHCIKVSISKSGFDIYILKLPANTQSICPGQLLVLHCGAAAPEANVKLVDGMMRAEDSGCGK